MEHTSDHVAKFHGDRPRELGDFAVRKNETPVKIRALMKCVFSKGVGRPQLLHSVKEHR